MKNLMEKTLKQSLWIVAWLLISSGVMLFQEGQLAAQMQTPSPVPALVCYATGPAKRTLGQATALIGWSYGGYWPVTYAWSATGPGSVSFENPATPTLNDGVNIARPSASFGAEGRYTLTLTCTDKQGATATARVITEVSSAYSCRASAGVDQHLVFPIRNKANLAASSSGGLPPYYYRWRTPAGVSPSVSRSQSIEASFARMGIFRILLDCHDANGAPSQDSVDIDLTNLAFSTNMTLNSVSVLDLLHNTVLTTLPVPGGPHNLSVSPDSRKVFVSLKNPLSVRVIDVVSLLNLLQAGSDPSLSLTETIPLDPGQMDVSWRTNQRVVTTCAPLGDRLFAATSINYALYGFGLPGNLADGSVSFNQTLTSNLALDAKLTPAGDQLFMIGSRWVWVVNPSTYEIADTLTPGGQALLIHPDGTRAYLLNAVGPHRVIDTQTHAVVGSIGSTGYFVQGAAITPDPDGSGPNPGGQYLYLLKAPDDQLIVLSTDDGSTVATLPLATYGDINNYLGTAGVAVSPDATQVYVPAPTQVVVIRTVNHTVTGTIPLGINPPGNQSHVMAILGSH